MASKIPDTTRAAILADLNNENGSTHQIAERHGVGKASVSRIAKNAGITLERSKTKIATEARVADNRAKRAIEAAESIGVAAQLRARILDATGGRDAQGWATAYGIMSDKHMAFDRHDTESGGLAAVDAWLRDVIGRDSA